MFLASNFNSVIEFAKGCDYAMRMVDEILDTLTKGEHSKTVDLIEERKKLDEEEAMRRRAQEEYEARVREEWTFVESLGLTNVPVTDAEVETSAEGSEPIDFEAVKSLRDLGIDTSFIDDIKTNLSSGYVQIAVLCISLVMNLNFAKLKRNGSLNIPIHYNNIEVLI